MACVGLLLESLQSLWLHHGRDDHGPEGAWTTIARLLASSTLTAAEKLVCGFSGVAFLWFLLTLNKDTPSQTRYHKPGVGHQSNLSPSKAKKKHRDDASTWSLHDPFKMGSMTPLFWVMAPFLKGHSGDSRYPFKPPPHPLATLGPQDEACVGLLFFTANFERHFSAAPEWINKHHRFSNSTGVVIQVVFSPPTLSWTHS